jgi:hypothetical protein
LCPCASTLKELTKQITMVKTNTLDNNCMGISLCIE